MQIVIDIPEEVYNGIISRGNFVSDFDLCGAFENGTPLPKGHGRLFILDEAKAKKYFTKFSFSVQDWISEIGISNATLKVIEADRRAKVDCSKTNCINCTNHNYCDYEADKEAEDDSEQENP